MTTQQVRRTWQVASAVLAALAVAVGAAAVAAWATDRLAVAMVIPGYSPMAPVTGVCLALLGTAVLLAPRAGRAARSAVVLLAGAVLAFSLLMLAEYALGRSFAVETWLFHDAVVATFPSFPGRPSLWTALALLLLSAAVVSIRLRRRWADLLCAGGLIVVAVLIEVVLVAYVFDAQDLTSLFGTKPPSLLTLVGLTLLLLSVMAARPDRPPLGFALDGADVVLLAWLVPLALALPILERVATVAVGWAGLSSTAAAVLAELGVSLLVSGLVVWLAVTRRRQHDALVAEQEGALQRERFRVAFRAAPTGIVLTDMEGRIEDCNDAFAALVGRDRALLIGQTTQSLSHPDDRDTGAAAAAAMLRDASTDRYRVDTRYVRPDGSSVWTDLSVSVVRDAAGQPAFLVGIATDLADRKRQEHLLTDAATRDPLTGLANRSVLDSWMDRWEHPAPPARTVMVFADLDEFKEVNDEYGHVVGDALLREVATRLSSTLRGDDLVARIGGDEFVVAATVAHDRDVVPLVQRLRAALDGVVVLEGHLVEVRVSLGMAVTDGGGAREALAVADERMYADKRRRKQSAAAAHPMAT